MDAKEAGKRMQAHRKRRRLTQSEVVEQSSVPTSQYLSALENGRYDIRNSEHFKSLVALYQLTPHEVKEVNPDAVIQVATPPRRGPPVPPVVDPLELPLVIPPELQQVIDEHGERYPELHHETTLRALVAPRLFAGPSQGPQTPQQWLEFFLMNRRWFQG